MSQVTVRQRKRAADLPVCAVRIIAGKRLGCVRGSGTRAKPVNPFKPRLHLASPIRGDINAGRRLLFGGAKLETGHASCYVQSGLRLDTERLQGNGLAGSSNQ